MIFYFFVALILSIASYMDFKRREIDDWLNLFLFFSCLGFIFIGRIETSSLINFGFYCFACFCISTLLCYSKFFSGGDAKLLFAISPIFFASAISRSFFNFGMFFCLLLVASSVYTIFFVLFLLFKNRDKFSLRKLAGENKVFLFFAVLLSVISVFYSFYFFVWFVVMAFAISFLRNAKKFESLCLTKNIGANELREGDWLAEKIIFRKKVFDYSWEGLSERDLKFLKSYKGKIKIKDGLPFGFAFLLAFIFYCVVIFLNPFSLV